MSNSSNIFKKVILIVVLSLLLLPVIQRHLNLFPVQDLKGYFAVATDQDFSTDEWFDRSFQERKESFLNEDFGFRPAFVRFNNQLRYSLFKTTSSAEALIGKDGYFFGNTYLRSYLGEDFIGVDTIIKKCFLVKEIQDKLKQNGQIFLPVFGPNKVRVLSNYLPDGVHKKGITNYELFKALFNKLNIRYIDFNEYFCKAYASSKYPLYSKYGTHWSHYGHTFAADSIINYLNYYDKLNTSTMVWDGITWSDTLQYPDNDIVDGMNLMVEQFPSEKMAYPKVSFTKNQINRPSLFVVGDSYNNGLVATDYQNQVFSDYKFLYYFKELQPLTYDKEAIYKLNLKQEIGSHKVILLVTGEFNMAEYGWGFLEKTSGLLNGKIKIEDLQCENTIEMMKEEIGRDKEWMKKIKEQASNEKISYDSLITSQAIYLAEIKISRENPNKDLRVKILEKKIRYNKGWMKDIAVKAKERNISIDSMIKADACWVIEQAK